MYRIEITETLSSCLKIDAAKSEAALAIARLMYASEKVVLTSEDFFDVSISIMDDPQS